MKAESNNLAKNDLHLQAQPKPLSILSTSEIKSKHKKKKMKPNMYFHNKDLFIQSTRTYAQVFAKYILSIFIEYLVSWYVDI